jgi:hypothetical protein
VEKYAYFRKEVLKYIVLDFENLFLEFGFLVLASISRSLAIEIIEHCDSIDRNSPPVSQSGFT